MQEQVHNDSSQCKNGPCSTQGVQGFEYAQLKRQMQLEAEKELPHELPSEPNDQADSAAEASMAS